ncbi:unnamed protein product [Cylicocyclus nassatus]|uniref:Uncharacterized protein n=1 Tax=Cylicocyclus nassatus TaxID=53992 RepID=A0AA36HAH4_CYLNA|nr:unnamed protein product [Cylicocyclus nassatus]
MSLKCVRLAGSSKILLNRGVHSSAPVHGVIRDALRKARELANASADGKNEVGKAVKDANQAEEEAYEQKKQKVDSVRADAEKRLENVQGLIGDLMQDASAALRHGK